MAIGSVTTASPSSALFGSGTTRSANDAAVAKLNRDADERAQLEFLSRHLDDLADALATIRENWRRSDEILPGSAAQAASLAVLTQAGDESVNLADLAAFSGVGAGTLTINGTDVAFDPASDSLQDVIDRINGAGAGVTAALDDSGLGLLITANDADADLELADGGAGLLDALGIDAGTIAPADGGRSPGMSWSRARVIAEAVSDAVNALNTIFSDEVPGGEVTAAFERSRKDLRSAVEGAWEADTTGLAANIGFAQDFEVESGDVMSFTRRSEGELVRSLRNRPATAEVMLFGAVSEAKDGLIGRLELRSGMIRQRLDVTFARRGYSVDAYA